MPLRAEVDGLGGGAPTGWVSFWDDGRKKLGFASLSSAGAGQETLGLGYEHSCALTSVGGVKCWGYSLSGPHNYTPVDVFRLTSGVTALAGGGAHTCALNIRGGVICWGYNAFGQLGDRTKTYRNIPANVFGLGSGVVAITAGARHSCALTSAGGMKCWGQNDGGRLGDGTTTQRYTPTDVSGLTSGVVAMTAGDGHTCALTKTGGVKCWGFNGAGQLGDGTATLRKTPVDVSGLAISVAAVAAGGWHTCVMTGAGGVKCWGQNDYGQLGDGTTASRKVPVDVSGLTSGVVAIAAGRYHTCALTNAGGVKCWGYNESGQIGDGTKTTRLTPVNVSGLTSGVSAIAEGASHSCAIRTAGGVKCWGANGNGALGDGTPRGRLTPVSTLNLLALSRARASLVAGPLGAGAHMLRAVFAGDATHSGSYDRLPQTVE
jgi:alpha-tubulin suppressor-like RCC1 family protein